MFRKIDRPMIMGILNITPDSFSDGGKHVAPESALRHALTMIAAGADMIDVGGESTRPGSEPVPVAEQINRVVPVIRLLKEQAPEKLVISIDTTASEVAEAALAAGATIINDISAGTHDPAILEVAAERNQPIILMHMQGTPKTMQDEPYYESVVDEVLEYLMERVQSALLAGVDKHNICIDPGIGFGKRKQDNIDLLAALTRFVDTGYPVLLGTSRKRFMGSICQIDNPAELVTATAVTTALGVMAGVHMFRVHDVKENRQAADIAWALKMAG